MSASLRCAKRYNSGRTNDINSVDDSNVEISGSYCQLNLSALNHPIDFYNVKRALCSRNSRSPLPTNFERLTKLKSCFPSVLAHAFDERRNFSIRSACCSLSCGLYCCNFTRSGREFRIKSDCQINRGIKPERTRWLDIAVLRGTVTIIFFDRSSP